MKLIPPFRIKLTPPGLYKKRIKINELMMRRRSISMFERRKKKVQNLISCLVRDGTDQMKAIKKNN